MQKKIIAEQAVMEYLAAKGVDWPSAAKFRFSLNAWIRHVGNHSELSAETVRIFRQKCSAAGLSPATYESQISDLLLAGKFCGVSVEPGHRHRRPRPTPRPASIDAIRGAYQHVSSWMKQWMAMAYWTCLRLNDSIKLQRELPKRPKDALRWSASKTGRPHVWPVPAWLQRHMVMQVVLPEGNPRNWIQALIRRELNQACDKAQVERFTPHELRTRGINEWMRSNAAAGAIVHGSGLGVLKHYLDPLTVLESAAPGVRIPAGFSTEEEKGGHEEIASIILKLDPEARNIVMQTANRLAR